jgi:hypothetical protein
MSVGIIGLTESSYPYPTSKASPAHQHQSSMGNASSSNIPCSSRRRSVFHSKPTGIVSQLHLTCTNVDSTMERIDSPTHETTALIPSERSQNKSESPTPRPSTTFRSSLIIANPPELPLDEATKSYHAFLHDFPGTLTPISWYMS